MSKCVNISTHIVAILFLCAHHLAAQKSITKYGIKQYGNTLEQPFHSSEHIRQDSIGRLVFRQGLTHYTFDGSSFTSSTRQSAGEFMITDNELNRWYYNDQHGLTRYGTDDTLTIDVKQYFKSGINDFYQISDTFRLVSHQGIARFIWQENHFEVLSIDSFDQFVAYKAKEIGDTTFIKTLSQSHFVINQNFANPQAYGPKNLSSYHNGIFYLNHNRIIYHREYADTMFSSASPYYHFIQSFPDKKIKSTTIDKLGRMWIVSSADHRHGIFLLDPDSGEEVQISVSDEIVSYTQSVYVDKNGGIWLGTSGAGLVHIYEKAIQVIGETAGLGDDNVWSTCQANNGIVYLTTRCAGIGMMEPGQSIRTYLQDGCAWSVIPVKEDIWIADNGVKKLQKGRVVKSLAKAEGLTSRRAFSLFQDSHEDIWIGTRMAIHKLRGDYVDQYIVPTVDIFDGVFNIEEYQPGKLLLVLKSGKIFTFKNSEFNEVTFTNKLTTRILKDQEGRIWLSTDGAGLYLFKEENFVKIDHAPMSVLQMQDDKKGNLWGIVAGNQMFYVNKDSLLQGESTTQIHYLTPDHGLPLISQNYEAQPTTTLLHDGRVLFPNIHGAILINPDEVEKPYPEFNIVVNKGHSSGYQYELDYGENDVRFQLTGINLHPERPIEFQYKYDGKWTNIENTANEFSLNNLTKGSHEIFVRGRHKNQSWFVPETIRVEVLPLFYQKTGIQLLTLLFVLAAMYTVVKWRTGIVKRQNAYLSQKVAEQTEEIENEKSQLASSLQQQQQLTKELSLSQKAKNRLYAQIAHEFKSPLQAMNTYLSKSQVSLTSSDQDRITKNIKNLLNTSNEILELSKAESGKLVAKKNYYNINSIISDQVELMQSLIEDKKIEIVFPQRIEKDYLFIDLSLFQKVMSNLLSNAIKFSPLNSTIHIDSKNRLNTQYIAVKDRGPGIPAEEVSALVVPYFQASNNVFGGTGIGLSFVENILKLHDSHLEIDTKVGSGSTFSFVLQRPEMSQSDIVKEFMDEHDIEHQLARLLNKDKPMILTVDDNEGVLHFYSSTLSKQYNVITALNGENALAALKRISPVLIISDVNMPIMGGGELLKHVRKKSNLKAVPFFFVTGSTSDEMEIQSLKSGVDVILKKPIQEDYLLSRIERALSSKSDLEDLVKSDFSHNMLPPDLQGDDMMLVQEMEAIILMHIDNNKLKSADIAALLGIGERTLRNRVKSISGLTIKAYLKNYRLEKAKILIEQSERTKAEIATAVGFSSLSYFSKSYKNYFGKS